MWLQQTYDYPRMYALSCLLGQRNDIMAQNAAMLLSAVVYAPKSAATAVADQATSKHSV